MLLTFSPPHLFTSSPAVGPRAFWEFESSPRGWESLRALKELSETLQALTPLWELSLKEALRVFTKPCFCIAMVAQNHVLFSRALRDSTPCFVCLLFRWCVSLSVHRLVGPSHFTYLGFCILWPHCSCPNDQVTLKTAPAHPHATGVAVYPHVW